MADQYLSSNRPIVDPKQPGIEIGFVDLLDRSGTVVASWGVHAPRCTIGSAQECSVRVENGSLAPNHLLLVFGKKFTLLKALAQPTRVAGRPVKEWLIDISTTIELGELTFVVHPFNSRPTSTVVRGDRLPMVASRMGAAPSQTLNQPSEESLPDEQLPYEELTEAIPECVPQTPSVPFCNKPAVYSQQEAPEELGEIKENPELLTAVVPELPSNSFQRQMDVQDDTEVAPLATTQKMLEGFADRWFTEIRRELSTLGNQQQESVSQLTVSLDNRLNSLEQRIETIAACSSEDSRVFTDRISSLANEQSELRNSLSELRTWQRQIPLPPPSQSTAYLPSLEMGSRSEASRHSRMDGAELVGGASGELPGQSTPYYASSTNDLQVHIDREFGESVQSASEPETPYQQAPHAMQWDAPVDESSDQTYVELLRRLEKNQTEVEKRSESLLAPDLPTSDSAGGATIGDALPNGWDDGSNNQFQSDDPESISTGDPIDGVAAVIAPTGKSLSEDLDYLRSMSDDQIVEPESIDLKQLREGIDSELIGSRLERLIADASDRRMFPKATENPLELLQSQPQVPEAAAEAAPSTDFGSNNPVEPLSMVEQVSLPSIELHDELNVEDDGVDSAERELQALYASLGLVRTPTRSAEVQNASDEEIADAFVANGLDPSDAEQHQILGGAGKEADDAPPYEESRTDERYLELEVNDAGLMEAIQVQAPKQTVDNFADIAELRVQNGASSMNANENNSGDQAESSGDSNAEEESIEDYMQRLLSRVRTGSSSTPIPVHANNRKSSLPSIPNRVTEFPNPSDEVPISEDSSMQDAFSPSTPLSRPFNRLPARAANRAPEAKADLDALRELANSNARRAIKRSDKRRNSADLLVNVAVSAFSLACAIVLLAMNGFRINATFLGMTSALLVSVLWGVDSVRTYRTILLHQREGSQAEDESSE